MYMNRHEKCNVLRGDELWGTWFNRKQFSERIYLENTMKMEEGT